ADVVKGLFPSANPLHQTVNIGRMRFRIIGIMEKQGGSFFGGPNFDRQVFIPITAYVKQFAGNHRNEDVTIAVKAPRQEAVPDLEFAVTGALRSIRGLRPGAPVNFSINKLDTLVGTFNNIMGVVLLSGLVITSMSL